MINSVVLIAVAVADVAKLDHAVIVSVIYQWRCRVSACVKSGGTHIVNTDSVFELRWP